MFLGDILWSLAKVRGYYLPGGFQDVLYMFLLRARGRRRARADARHCGAGAHHVEYLGRSGALLPYAAMLAAFLVLVYLAPRRHSRAIDRDGP